MTQAKPDQTKVSPKQFLHRSGSGKASTSALAFLESYREFLQTGEVSQNTSPILAKMDRKELPASSCLDEIKQAVAYHLYLQDSLKAQELLNKVEQNATATSNKPFLGVVYEADGNVATKLTSKGEITNIMRGFDSPQEAHRWVEYRLNEAAPNCYGEVIHSQVILKNGLAMVQKVSRDRAIAVCTPAMKQIISKQPKGGGSTANKMRAKGDKFYFSRG